MTITGNWVAVDWGSTHIRATLMRGAEPLDRREGANAARPGAESHEAAFRALAGDWLRPGGATIAVACGMVGARHGWTEARYLKVPAGMDLAGALVAAPVSGADLRFYIVPGLSQDRPAEVIRGEETQIAGFLAGRPDFDGVLCLPGTHTKWAHVSAREVVSFRTAMTGELFSLLAAQSVLRHTVAPSGDDAAAFAEAVSQTMARPERLAADLFAIRAEGILHGLDPTAARARLSGLLIGAELAAMRPYWLGQQVAIVGAPGLNAIYARALEGLGVMCELADGAAAALAGLTAIRNGLRE